MAYTLPEDGSPPPDAGLQPAPSKRAVNVARVPMPVRALWAMLGRVDCAGRCWSSCGPWAASSAEWGILRGIEHRTADGALCPYLTPEGRCGVHRVRPLICRAWGVVPELACPWGCKVTGPRPTVAEIAVAARELGLDMTDGHGPWGATGDRESVYALIENAFGPEAADAARAADGERFDAALDRAGIPREG